MLSDSVNNVEYNEKVIPFQKLQDNCNNLQDFLDKAGVVGSQVNRDRIADSKLVAKQIL